MLTLSWSDGNTLIPINSCLLVSAKDANIAGLVKDFDNRTLAGKDVSLSRQKHRRLVNLFMDTISALLKSKLKVA